MQYSNSAIPDSAVPRAADPVFQHVVDTYASETNKLISTWREFRDSDLSFRPHAKSPCVEENFKHQLLSERRFFFEFIGTPAPPASEVLPEQSTVDAFCTRMRELAEPRLAFLAEHSAPWWLEEGPFFDTTRQRIWIF